ncbi:hypothetical protein ACFYO7_19845 [Nocardia salmonicida]|uniref:hypothetical protein n=1 Tax=Nocardia salmonicida TaxID=53431 RepID=UPI0036C1F19B
MPATSDESSITWSIHRHIRFTVTDVALPQEFPPLRVRKRNRFIDRDSDERKDHVNPMVDPIERDDAIPSAARPLPGVPRAPEWSNWEGALLLGIELAATVHDASERALLAELALSAARCAREGIPMAALRQAVSEEVAATLPTLPCTVDPSTEHAIRTALITTTMRAYTAGGVQTSPRLS